MMRIQRHGNRVHLSALSQRVLESLHSQSCFTRPKPKYDLRKVDHMPVSNRAGCLALRQPQFNHTVDFI